jgi:hypothetical protein
LVHFRQLSAKRSIPAVFDRELGVFEIAMILASRRELPLLFSAALIFRLKVAESQLL